MMCFSFEPFLPGYGWDLAVAKTSGREQNLSVNDWTSPGHIRQLLFTAELVNLPFHLLQPSGTDRIYTGQMAVRLQALQ